MIAKVFSAIPYGYDGRIVEVEGDISKSLPAFNIVGMANKTISEARERVRSAITNSGFSFPDKKVTINLAPAELSKDGAHLDLPIALATLIMSKQLLQSDLDQRLFVGELSLDGFMKPVRGIINILEAARSHGFKEVYIPRNNLAQASLITGINIIGISSLQELVLHLKNIKTIRQAPPATNIDVKNTKTDSPTLDDVRGQDLVKRALTIAIAGRHNILLSGPPGAGKTLLAKVAASLLSPMSNMEIIETTKVHSLCDDRNQIVSTRPFRAPHHTASAVSIIGGGSQALPGEISMAHHGVLFLDEIPEYPRSVLETLRQPLEDRQITITRANAHATYPANFMLIATMNPCPCGYLNDKTHECVCTAQQINSYRKRLSGPILDRIDMIINVPKVDSSDLLSKPVKVKKSATDVDRLSNADHSEMLQVKNTRTGLTQQQIAKKQISQAVCNQQARYQNEQFYNSMLSSRDISNYVKITPTAYDLLNQATDKLQLSARAYFKIIKVAQTIADMASLTEVDSEHISEALAFRQVLQ